MSLSCDGMSLEASSTSDFGNTYHEGELFVEEGTNQPVFDFSVYHTQGPEFISPGAGILDPIELDILSPF